MDAKATHTTPPGAVLEATEVDFDALVIERSRDVPVLVDFWAPWCGPCRMLGPVLERVAADHVGRLEVVKLNTDAAPAIAQRYRISSIPAVKLFVDGVVVDEFVGALPEPRVRAFLDAHVPSTARLHAEAEVAQARAALAAGDLDGAAALARDVPVSTPSWEVAQALLALIDLARDAAAAGAPDEVAARVDAAGDAADPADRFARAIHRAAAGDPRAALDDLLALVERHRRWRDEAARKAMLTIFTLEGTRSPLSDEYRKRLAILI